MRIKRDIPEFGLIVCIVIVMTIIGYNVVQADRVREAEKMRRWLQFEKCIEAHPSDAVCDSCWTAIFGKDATPEQVTPKHILNH